MSNRFCKLKRKAWSPSDSRFQECLECRFFRKNNTDTHCGGCEIGEHFEARVEELNPYADHFLSKTER